MALIINSNEWEHAMQCVLSLEATLRHRWWWWWLGRMSLKWTILCQLER